MDSKLARAAEDPLVKQDENLQLEQDVIVPLAASRKVYVHETTDFWRQMKTAAYVPFTPLISSSLTDSSAVTASSLYLSRYHRTAPSLLCKTNSSIIQPCYIDPSATIAPSAKIGPNVAIGPFVNIGEGVRVKDAIIMEGSTLERHACVINSIVGSNCSIGPWARVDGIPEPEQDTKEISVTVLATEVSLAAETLVRSCIVLPNVSS